MPTVHFGGKDEPAHQLEKSDDMIAVRTLSRRSVRAAAGTVPTPSAGEVDDGELVVAFPEAGVEVYRVPTEKRSLEDRKLALRAARDVRFAGGVLIDPASGDPVIYTENLFVKFRDAADPDDCKAVLQEAGLTIKRELEFAVNSYFVAVPEGTGVEVFDVAETLLKRDDVEYCHPELVRERAMRAIFPQQWHLKATTIGGVAINAHANVEAAQEITMGDGTTIAVIDNGADLDHPEFARPGKIVAPRDVTRRSDDPRPQFGDENHGTACSGVACAAGVVGASGVAPRARLMPIRLASGLGSINEADAFRWAADNGADVISCSWGPVDGRWFNPNDPRHNQVVPLPASTRMAMEYATTRGRGGKGCVILFAAGNGNETVDNDGYASAEFVVAVAACNDRGKRSVYSDFGTAVWCAFPSNDLGHIPFGVPDPLTPGIWTTDRVGSAGYNPGDPRDGDAAGLFANDFGGTSSACPGAAGVAALVLSVNPDLGWREVKELLKRSCDRIDPQGGAYGSDGRSNLYGFGRLNARTAVELARPQPRNGVNVSRTFDAPIPDLQTVAFTLEVADATVVESLAVSVDLKHTFIGDLVITLIPPPASGNGRIRLHNRAGGNTKNLARTFNASTTPALRGFRGKSCKGTWTLQVQDAAAQDEGVLHTFSLQLTFAHPDGGSTRALLAAESHDAVPSRNGSRRAKPRKKAAASG